MRMTVNGVEHALEGSPDRSLLAVLREELGLTGAKYGCGEGACGACTVLLDGRAVYACTLPIAEAIGHAVTTVEGLATDGRLHPVQQAFVDEAAMQCGFCTAGMVVRAVSLLAGDPHPDDAAVRAAMDGNVCRCGTYPRILRAVRRAVGHPGTTGLEAPGPGPAVSPAPADPLRAPGFVGRPARPWDLTPPDERDYFGALGDGLVAILAPESGRRLSPLRGPWAANGGAWIHVGAGGVVTAFSGKVDFGQDNRTALGRIVAAELGVPLDAVRLVLGDTDVCPFDIGTFGSRSMADAGAYLRAAAGIARRALLELASERLEAHPRDLVAAEGRIQPRGGGPSVGLDELLRGVRRIEEEAGPGSEATAVGPVPAPSAGPGDSQVVGQRRGAAEIVTGDRRFPADLERPGMLHGRVLRPPAFGARLRTIDTSGAEAVAGVRVVHDGSFVGVVAPDRERAGAALRAISAEWDRDPQPAERDIVGYLRAHPVEIEGWGGSSLDETGDVDAALAAAPVRLDRTYTAAYIAHVPLETRVALAEWDGDRLTVWTGTQQPFNVRRAIAGVLGVAEERVRVVVPDTGGGWGGKHAPDVAIEAARLARASRRPVKVRWSRQEEFSSAYIRPFAIIDVRAGATAGGRLTAWDFTNLNAGSAAIATPYEVPDQRVRFQPADSPLPQGSYRALAATANHFARESHMDELARALALDPLDFRLRNLRDERLAVVFRAAADRAGWANRGSGKGAGLGIAGGVEKGGRVATVAEVRLDGEGRLDLVRLVTAYECGRIVDPANLANQVEGAAVMGLGGALFEAIHFADGRILNGTMTDYRVPRFTDVPVIDVVLVDRPDQPSAGAGETPIVAIAPAIANAIVAAGGPRLRNMPLAPDGVIDAAGAG